MVPHKTQQEPQILLLSGMLEIVSLGMFVDKTHCRGRIVEIKLYNGDLEIAAFPTGDIFLPAKGPLDDRCGVKLGC